jgi:hypothetical protein
VKYKSIRYHVYGHDWSAVEGVQGETPVGEARYIGGGTVIGTWYVGRIKLGLNRKVLATGMQCRWNGLPLSLTSTDTFEWGLESMILGDLGDLWLKFVLGIARTGTCTWNIFSVDEGLSVPRSLGMNGSPAMW